MTNRPSTKSNHIFGVLFVMIFGGCLCLILLLSINFQNGSGFEDKTLWDWFDLFLIPVLLVSCLPVVYWFTKKAQEQRAVSEQEIALDNQREALMNSYIDLMTTLFLKGVSPSEGDHDEQNA